MLKSKRFRCIHRKPDWYNSKVRVHFDLPLSREKAERFVTDPIRIRLHDFLPLISFSKKERRFRKAEGDKKPTASTKIRELAYPSNHDGYVFAYYAELLNVRYEQELTSRGLEKVVIGYRKGASNIKLACEAFREIKTRGNCAALALDIKGFFDNISHHVLKEAWIGLLREETLPEDHYKVFRALTASAKMDRAELLVRLGIASNARDRDLPRPLGSSASFRKLRDDAFASTKLVRRHVEKKGIPQGTPLSAMAANLSMMQFDSAVHAAVSRVGGSYRRYSDDILILCSAEDIGVLEYIVQDTLKSHTSTLSLNTSKREEVNFALPGPALVVCAPQVIVKPLQYLGFTFDGQRVLIRGGTLSRFYRRLSSSVRVAKFRAALAKTGQISGRIVVHKREILAKHSHLGSQSFINSYARNSADAMEGLGSDAIRQQISGHMGALNRRLAD